MPIAQAKLELLFLSAQDGDHEAFTRLYEEHHTALLRYARMLTPVGTIADDATQEAWINFAKNIRKVKDPRAYRAWLYKLTRWRVTDLARKHAKEVNELDSDLENHIVDADETMSGADNNISLSDEIKKLPTTERQIIQLFYLDEFNTTEIAEALEIPKGTVKSRLYRARKLLKDKLQSTI